MIRKWEKQTFQKSHNLAKNNVKFRMNSFVFHVSLLSSHFDERANNDHQVLINYPIRERAHSWNCSGFSTYFIKKIRWICLELIPHIRIIDPCGRLVSAGQLHIKNSEGDPDGINIPSQRDSRMYNFRMHRPANLNKSWSISDRALNVCRYAVFAILVRTIVKGTVDNCRQWA